MFVFLDEFAARGGIALGCGELVVGERDLLQEAAHAVARRDLVGDVARGVVVARQAGHADGAGCPHGGRAEPVVAPHIAEVGHPGGAGLRIDAHLDHASRAIVDPCDGAHAQQRASPVGSAGSAQQKQEQHQGWALERMRTVGPLTVRDAAAACRRVGKHSVARPARSRVPQPRPCLGGYERSLHCTALRCASTHPPHRDPKPTFATLSP